MLVASWSKDPSTKVGAVLADGKHVLSHGYNGFPHTCEDKEEWLNDRETKYKLVTHAEVNAIFNSKVPVAGSTVYTYPLPPCAACAGILAAAGIKRVVSCVDPTATSTKKYIDFSDTEFIFNANGIEFEWLSPSKLS